MADFLSTNTLSRRQIGILLFGRWTLNTAFRVVYPLLPFLASSFNIDARTASLLVTVQVGAPLLSPLGGMLADRRGERETMVWGMACFCVGTLLCALSSSFVPFLIGYGVIGLSTTLYPASAQAYASARTPYAQRGRILGILELSWAVAALIGVSTLTYVVTLTDNRSAIFLILLALGSISLLTTHLGLDPIARPQGDSEQVRKAQSLKPLALLQPQILGALGLVFCMIMATELVFISYAAWLERDFSATVEQVGLVLALLGAAELIGSGGSAWLVDRFGKRRSVLVGLTLSGLAQALLPFSAGNWPLFLVLFLVFGLSFEYAIVSYFPLISGVLPRARGTMLSISLAVTGSGRMISSLVGPALWTSGGFLTSSLFAAALSFAGVAIGLLFVREGND